MSSSPIIYSWNICIRKGLYSTSSNSTLFDCVNLTIIANSLDEARKKYEYSNENTLYNRCIFIKMTSYNEYNNIRDLIFNEEPNFISDNGIQIIKLK
jgi:hypothetical protein